MTKKIVLMLSILIIPAILIAQSGSDAPRPITMEEYELAQTFEVSDLDNDTYVKVGDGDYILDRYELRQPIYITGDDGIQKRVDIYKLVEHENLDELGLLFFYTNENNEVYKALLPNYTADGDVWEQYFEDIHAIDKVEKNYVLKLSYVLSRELSFQMFKNMQGDEFIEENATYGSDICFPGDQLVELTDGRVKQMKNVLPGDKIMTHNPATNSRKVTTVDELVVHMPSNYAITKLTLMHSDRLVLKDGVYIKLSIRELKATPNHPMTTSKGNVEIGSIEAGDEILGWNDHENTYRTFMVLNTVEITEGVQPVYSIKASDESPIKINGVLVRQK